METDALVGAAAGLLAVGVMAGVANKMLNEPRRKTKKQKGKRKDSFW
jgi:hypothetical protein